MNVRSYQTLPKQRCTCIGRLPAPSDAAQNLEKPTSRLGEPLIEVQSVFVCTIPRTFPEFAPRLLVLTDVVSFCGRPVDY